MPFWDAPQRFCFRSTIYAPPRFMLAARLTLCGQFVFARRGNYLPPRALVFLIFISKQNRGLFFESYQKQRYSEFGIDDDFIHEVPKSLDINIAEFFSGVQSSSPSSSSQSSPFGKYLPAIYKVEVF